MVLGDIEPLKTAGDVVSVTVVAGSLVGILPAIASVTTIVWTCLRIYETKAVQDWLKQRRTKK